MLRIIFLKIYLADWSLLPRRIEIVLKYIQSETMAHAYSSLQTKRREFGAYKSMSAESPLIPRRNASASVGLGANNSTLPDLSFLASCELRRPDTDYSPPSFIVRTGSLRRRNRSCASANKSVQEACTKAAGPGVGKMPSLGEETVFPSYVLQSGCFQWMGR